VEDLEQIFDRFYRSRGTAERATGKGLGLTVCKRLVEALEGQIWAENRPGSGLAVSFTLAVAEVKEWQQEAPSPAS
jgi:signal transduction histidine kinase